MEMGNHIRVPGCAAMGLGTKDIRMSEQGFKTRERLAKAIARQTGAKICPRCHVGIITNESGICDNCKDYPIQKLPRNQGRASCGQIITHYLMRKDK